MNILKKYPQVLIMISAFCFALMAVCVKFLSDMPVFEKVLFRNLVMLIIIFPIILKLKVNFKGESESRKFLLFRSFLGFAGVSFYFYAISQIQLGDATMLNKLSPFFVTIFGAIILKEKLPKFQIPLLIMAFIGAGLIIKPSLNSAIVPSLAGFCSGLCAGSAYTVVRYLGKKEHPFTVIFYFCVISVILSMIAILITQDFVIPTWKDFIVLIGIGTFAAGGQFFITIAYKYGKATEISIYNYVNIVFALIFGAIFFKEFPDMWSIYGGLLIITSAIISFVYKTKSNRYK